MSTPKGWPATKKDARITAEHVTISPVSPTKSALDVRMLAWSSIGSDAVEAGSDTYTIVATAHVALRGDVIRFTSGALDTYEATVYATDTNSITLAETLPVAPSAADGFDIYRTDISQTGSGVGFPDPMLQRGDIIYRNAVNATTRLGAGAADTVLKSDGTDIAYGLVGHDELTDVVADEHIAHSWVDITAGEGLSGGGDISASRTLNLDIDELTGSLTPDAVNDYVAVYDTSAGGHKKVLLSDLGYQASMSVGALEITPVDATAIPVISGSYAEAVKMMVLVFRESTTTTVYEMFDLYAYNRSGTWQIEYSSHFDSSGVVFTIDTSGADGQVQYTAASIGGVYDLGRLTVSNIQHIRAGV